MTGSYDFIFMRIFLELDKKTNIPKNFYLSPFSRDTLVIWFP